MGNTKIDEGNFFNPFRCFIYRFLIFQNVDSRRIYLLPNQNCYISKSSESPKSEDLDLIAAIKFDLIVYELSTIDW